MNLTITNVERTWVDVPYRPVPRRNMIRELPHWGAATAPVERALGKRATEVMWDDSLGAGLQMVVFDAVGGARADCRRLLLGVP